MFGISIGTWLKAGAVLAVLTGLAWSHTAAYQAGRAGGIRGKDQPGERRCGEGG